MLHFDPKILQALQKVGEQMMKEAKRRRMNTPPSSFATGGYVSYPPFDYPPFDYPPFEDREPIFWDKTYRAEKIHPQSLLTMYSWTGIWNSLNTVQKMRVFRFVYKIEIAEEI